MAFGAKQIPPLDTRPGTGIGVTLPFNSPAVFFSSYTTQDAIRNNLINFFLTDQTERYLNVEFGANLRKYIYEQINSDNMSFLKNDIQNLINTYFPSVIVENLSIDQYPDNNEIVVNIKYSIINTGITDEIQINFE